MGKILLLVVLCSLPLTTAPAVAAENAPALSTPAAAAPAPPAPQVPSPEPTGTLDLESLRGKVVYLDFWASWCGPCLQSFPWLTTLQDRHGAEGLVVIGINLDRDRKAAEAFLKKHPTSFRIVYDPEGKLAKAWDIEVMPSSFLLDRDGKTRSDHQGFRGGDASRIETEIAALLKEAPTPPRETPGP